MRCKHTLNRLRHFAEWRVIRWLRKRHRWRWNAFRRGFTTMTGPWLPKLTGGVALFNPADGHPLPGNKIPNPFTRPNHA